MTPSGIGLELSNIETLTFEIELPSVPAVGHVVSIAYSFLAERFGSLLDQSRPRLHRDVDLSAPWTAWVVKSVVWHLRCSAPVVRPFITLIPVKAE